MHYLSALTHPFCVTWLEFYQQLHDDTHSNYDDENDNDDDETETELDDYVREQRNFLLESFDKAYQSITQCEKERKKRHEAKGVEEILKEGTKINLRKRYIGRAKLKDVYSADPFVIIGNVKDGNGITYEIKSVYGGNTQRVNRSNFRVVGMDDSDSEDDVQEDDEESLSGDEYIQEESPKLRRSSRSTKGQNRNPHNLPVSAVQRDIAGLVDQPNVVNINFNNCNNCTCNNGTNYT